MTKKAKTIAQAKADANAERAAHVAEAKMSGAKPAPKAPAKAAEPKADAAEKAAAIRADIKADRAPAKAAKGKAASKAKAAPAGNGARKGSKAETAYTMLTRKAGATRAAIVEACDGWGIDIKQFAARKGLKLRQDKDGTYFATPKA